MTTEIIVNPDDLRFDYRPFDNPPESHLTNSAGEIIDTTKRGVMRAVWDSPEGAFYLAWAVAEDTTEMYDAEPQLRKHVAALLGEAYRDAGNVRQLPTRRTA